MTLLGKHMEIISLRFTRLKLIYVINYFKNIYVITLFLSLHQKCQCNVPIFRDTITKNSKTKVKY